MALHYWVAPCLLENPWKLKVPTSLALLPKTDLFFLVMMEKQWVFNMVMCKIRPPAFLFPSVPQAIKGMSFLRSSGFAVGCGRLKIPVPIFLCFSLGMGHLNVPGWKQGSQDGPKDLNSQLCDTVERAWNLVRKQDINPCSAIYWSWEGCFSPQVCFPIYEIERVIPSVCLPTISVWEGQMRWMWSSFRCSLPLPHQAGAHPFPLCLGVWAVASVGSWAASSWRKQKRICHMTGSLC